VAAPAIFIELRTPDELRVQRAAQRELAGGSVSDAGAQLVASGRLSWEDLDELPAHDRAVLRGDRPPAAQLQDLAGLLDGRMRAGAG